jgi:hypothetical protein
MQPESSPQAGEAEKEDGKGLRLVKETVFRCREEMRNSAPEELMTEQERRMWEEWEEELKRRGWTEEGTKKQVSEEMSTDKKRCQRIGPSISFNLLTDSDRYFRGKIAELIFSKVANRLVPELRESLLLCSTWGLHNFLWELRRACSLEEFLKKDFIAELAEVDRRLEEWCSRLGVEKVERKSDWFCSLCGRESEQRMFGFSTGHFCGRCYTKIHELQESEQKELLGVVKRFQFLWERLPVIRVLARLGGKDKEFLWKVYGVFQPHSPFDYIGVGSDGSKFLIDVTSVRERGSVANFTENEREILPRALSLGFRVLRPVIYWEKDWRIRIELEEVIH